MHNDIIHSVFSKVCCYFTVTTIVISIQSSNEKNDANEHTKVYSLYLFNAMAILAILLHRKCRLYHSKLEPVKDTLHCLLCKSLLLLLSFQPGCCKEMSFYLSHLGGSA